MYKLTLEDADGATLTFGDGQPYTISEIEGLSPPEATINLNELALIDGQQYNSAKVSARTMNIAFAIEYKAEQNRLAAYKVLRVKKPITIYYKSDLRDVWIKGYIASVNVTHFEMKQICTVSIICPFPYFRSAQEIVNELSVIVSNFHFPFYGLESNNVVFSYVQNVQNVTVENNGEVDTGLIITLYIKGNITNPKIFNYNTGSYFGLNYSFEAGDEVTINTITGEKTVTLLRDSETINIFNYVSEGSTWLQIEGWQSTFVYEVGSGSLSNIEVTFTHYDLYEGV